MRSKRSNEIRTPREDVMVGERVMRGPEPVLLVKHGQKQDFISMGELAEKLHGPGAQCLIILPETGRRKAI